ncbi:MAG: hypothetical protein EXR75_08670 [Myxococcales bacterium]|nr:hypothetical protein [Myxococcales bacterium]
MSTRTDTMGAPLQVIDHDESEGVLSGAYYAAPRAGVVRAARANKEKPSHYKVICISMYTETLSKLDEMVDELKRRGLTKANRSALLRHALELVDLDAVPRGL